MLRDTSTAKTSSRSTASAADAIAGTDRPQLRAGIQIRLAAGWKTYWRYPGDSGVPPRFDFTHSENVKDVVVAWPAPHAFTEEGSVSIGYQGDVIFPLVVIPQDPRKPTLLRLDLDYAGMDCGLMPDGRVVLFEANANMLIHLYESRESYPYKHAYVPRIFDAAARMIERTRAKLG